MQTVIREAQAADAPRIAEIHEQSIRGLATEAYPTEVIEAWASGKDPTNYPIDDEGSYFVVAEHDTEVAGFGELVIQSADYFHTDVSGEIRAIYINPDYARMGIGSAIYAELEATAREQQIGSIGLWASLNAVPFYESQSFERVKRITHEFGGEEEGPAVEMKKVL